jgi:hypothetical protein
MKPFLLGSYLTMSGPKSLSVMILFCRRVHGRVISAATTCSEVVWSCGGSYSSALGPGEDGASGSCGISGTGTRSGDDGNAADSGS